VVRFLGFGRARLARGLFPHFRLEIENLWMMLIRCHIGKGAVRGIHVYNGY
jgi:hypothetical protein